MAARRLRDLCTIGDLREALFDPDFDVSEDGWSIIELVKHCCGTDHRSRELIQQLLLRLVADSPHVYAITVGQFPGFEGIEAFWKTHGYYDTRGRLWLVPRAFRPRKT